MRAIAAPIAACLVSSLLVTPAQAESAVPTRWQLDALLEADQEGGAAALAAASYGAGERTTLSFQVTYADTASNLSGLSTQGIEAGLYHDLGAVGFELRVGRWQDEDLLQAGELNVAVDWHNDNWSVALLGEFRQSDFEPFPVAGIVTLRDGTQLLVSGSADCDLDDTGVGARVSSSGDRWSGYVTGMTFDYDTADCRFSSPGLDRLQRANPEMFRQFAGRITAPLAVSAQTHIGAENAFLDSSVGAGIEYRAAARSYALDYLHSREQFEGLVSDTLSATVTFMLSATTDLGLTTGVSDGDLLDTLWFAGIGMSARF